MKPSIEEAPVAGTVPGPSTLAAGLYRHLRNDILFARLRPGQRLRSDALRLRYGSSVGTLREALNRLRAEGLVEQWDQRGFRVASVSLDELRELTKTRCWVNDIAVRESIRNGDAAWEEHVVLTFHRLTRITREEAPINSDDAALQSHRNFHASLYAACGARRLIAFADELFDSAVRYQNLALSVDPQVRKIRDEHRAIMEAAVARDSDLTLSLLEQHLWETTDRLARVLNFRGEV